MSEREGERERVCVCHIHAYIHTCRSPVQLSCRSRRARTVLISKGGGLREEARREDGVAEETAQAWCCVWQKRFSFIEYSLVWQKRRFCRVAEPRPLLVFFCLQQSTITVPASTTATVLTGVSMIVFESMPL